MPKSGVEEVKRVANDYMKLQKRLFHEMQSLDETEFVEFIKWYGDQAYDFLKWQTNLPPRNTASRSATSG